MSEQTKQPTQTPSDVINTRWADLATEAQSLQRLRVAATTKRDEANAELARLRDLELRIEGAQQVLREIFQQVEAANKAAIDNALAKMSEATGNKKLSTLLDGSSPETIEAWMEMVRLHPDKVEVDFADAIEKEIGSLHDAIVK